jgi:hypothetical protein
VIALASPSEFIHTMDKTARNTRRGLSPMIKNAIPPDLAGMFAACEDAFEQATQEGYAENPTVIAALAALKSAWWALDVANQRLLITKGFFAVEFATMRVERACRASREACIKLCAAIEDAAAEHRLYNRCLTLASQSPDADQASDKVTARRNERLRRLA